MTMKFTANKKALLKAASVAASAADARAAQPILSHVLVEAGDVYVLVSGTNLNIGSSSEAQARVESSGRACLPAKQFVDRVKAMPDGDVVVSVDSDAKVTLAAASAARRYTISGFPAEDFPPLPEAGGKRAMMPLDTLRKLIISTQFSISGDQTRLHLASALFEIEGGLARMVSTDGHRLSLIECSFPCDFEAKGLLVPGEGIQEIRRAIEAMAEGGLTECAIHIAEKHLFVSGGGTTLSVKLVDAQFPPYQQVIPKGNATELIVLRAQLLDTVRAVALSADSRNNGVRFEVSAKSLIVSCSSPESGHASDEIECGVKGHTSFQTGLSARYLADVLGAIETSQVELRCGPEEVSPVVIHAHPVDEKKLFTAVIMPMRI